MSISVLVAIAGVLVAAVGTGLLGGRCIRRPAPSFIAWTVAMLATTAALLAESIGFASGFGPAIFRVIQISAQLVAPVALAWGLVELVARGPAARFGARLAAVALVIVVGVVLATDPLADKPFGKIWPSASVHYQLIPHHALIGLHLAVLLSAVVAVSLCAGRARSGPAGRSPLPGAAAVAAGTAALVALRFPLPADAAYPALTAAAAGLVWLGMTRIGDAAPASSRAAARAGPGSVRAGGQWPPGPGSPDPDALTGGYDPGDFRADGPAGGAGRRGRGSGPYPPGTPGADAVPGGRGEPATGRDRFPAPASPRPAAREAGAGKPSAPPYGLIAIYTLLEDRVADFDRIADQAAEEVRAHEPDTLVYVIHTVPKAPMQRIFYEIYRDRAAYDRHEQQAYIKRFITARRPYVLATNVIELRLKYAKISPLGQTGTQPAGTGEVSGAGPAAPALQAGGAQAGPRLQGRSAARADPGRDGRPADRGDRPVAARGAREPGQQLPASQRRHGGI